MHPAEALKGASDRVLWDRRIVLCVTGSIAAVETVKLARMLIRHGAEVHPVMSGSAAGIIHPDALEFACGRRPVTELTGGVEHVDLCGLNPDRADLVLVAPATANTISKIARGIDDTPVTTVVSTAVGTGIPVLISPAMHQSMYDNPFVVANVEALEWAGRDGKADVAFIEPIREESKAKLAPLEIIVSEVIRRAGPGGMEYADVTVISGAGFEPVDDMRILTNRATGMTGVALAREAYHRGARVTLIHGRGELPDLPGGIPVARFGTNASLVDIVEDLPVEPAGGERIFFTPAAVTDYRPVRQKGKIPSGQDGVAIELEPQPKIVAMLRERFPDSRLVLFKAESGVDREELERRAQERMVQLGAFMAVANDLRDVDDDGTTAVILHRGGERRVFSGSREELASAVLGYFTLGPEETGGCRGGDDA